MAFDLFHLAQPHQQRRLSLADIIGAVGGAVGGAGQGFANYAQGAQEGQQNTAVAKYLGGGGQPSGGGAPVTQQYFGGGTPASSGGGMSPSLVQQIIQQNASPQNAPAMLATAQAEGGMRNATGDAGSSFSPFQMHYGHMAGGGNAVGGLGDVYQRETGQTRQDIQTPEGLAKLTKWLSDHWQQYGTPQTFHAQTTPGYQQALQRFQGGGATPGAAPTQQAAAQPQQGMDIHQEFQKFAQSSGLPPAQAAHVFQTQILPMIQKQSQMELAAERANNASQHLQLQAQNYASEAERRTAMTKMDQQKMELANRKLEEHKNEFAQHQQNWKDKQERIADEKDDAKRTKLTNGLISDKQKYINDQKSLLSDYQRAAGSPFVDKTQLAATYGDPSQIADRIRQTEQEVAQLRAQQMAGGGQAPARSALTQRGYGGTQATPQPAQQPSQAPAKGSAAAATAQKPMTQLSKDPKQADAEYAKLPSGAEFIGPDGKPYRKP